MINKIIEFFENEPDIYTACIEELDSYNGFLCYDRIYLMEDLPYFVHCDDPLRLLYMSFCGYHQYRSFEECYTVNPHRDQFNPNAEYFYFNGYSNLVSCNVKDYSFLLDADLIYKFAEHRSEIFTIDNTEELKELFDELENNS